MRKLIPDTIKNFPFCFLLFPIFFVLHGWKENFEYISFHDILILGCTYLLSSIIVFLIFLVLFRQTPKAGIYTFFILLVFLLFGAMQDFLRAIQLLESLSRYRYLLPSLGLFLLISFILLKKKKTSLNKFNFFLTILILVFIAIDAFSLIRMALSKESSPGVVASNSVGTQCEGCAKPDIYFLIFDEYASSRSLQDFLHYDNNSFESSLRARGFHIIPGSRSNYDFTIFSLASMLNMEYVQGVKDFNASSVKDFASCINLIRNNKVVDFLESSGYQIINYSIFDLKGRPSIVNQTFLPLKVSLITEQTLINRVSRDLGHFRLYSGLHSNELFTQKLLDESRRKTDQPRFIYVHFFMPHQPYYFDSLGRSRDKQTLLAETDHFGKESYLQYLKYTNEKALQLVDSILNNNATPPIIMLMGDHGCRGVTNATNSDHMFMNMNAIHIPGGSYNRFYDSLSVVNQFRILFNTQFHQSFELLKDSSILVGIKN